MKHALAGISTRVIAADTDHRSMVETIATSSTPPLKHRSMNRIKEHQAERNQHANNQRRGDNQVNIQGVLIHKFNNAIVIHENTSKNMVAGVGIEPTPPDTHSGGLPLPYPAILKVYIQLKGFVPPHGGYTVGRTGKKKRREEKLKNIKHRGDVQNRYGGTNHVHSYTQQENRVPHIQLLL